MLKSKELKTDPWGQSSWADSFEARTGHPSGPGDLPDLRLASLVKTIEGVIVTISRVVTLLTKQIQ